MTAARLANVTEDQTQPAALALPTASPVYPQSSAELGVLLPPLVALSGLPFLPY